MLDSFIGAALSIVVPLLMLDKKVDLATIGVVSSIMPLVFTSLRVMFASLADQAGLKFFFILDCLSSAAASLIYSVSSTGNMFLNGKVMEGARNASFWSVDRTAIFEESATLADREKNAASLSAIRTFGTAAGTILAGIGIMYFSFANILIGIAVLSLALLIPVLGMKNHLHKRPDIFTTLKQVDVRNKHPLIWKAGIAMSFYGIANALVISFVLPIFLRSSINLDYGSIGFLFAAYYLVDASATYFAIKSRIPFPKLAVIQSILFCVAAMLLPFASSFAQVLLLLVILAIGDGFSAIFFESIIADATKGSPTISTDVGLIHVPYHVSIFITLFSAGFIAQTFGFQGVFWLAALAFSICSLLSLAFVNHETVRVVFFNWLLRKRVN